MSIEILDRGACKAAGIVTLGTPPQCIGQGVRSIEGTGAGQVVLTLVDQIAGDALIVLTSGGAQQVPFAPGTLAFQALPGVEVFEFVALSIPGGAVAGTGSADPIPPPTPTPQLLKGFAFIDSNGGVVFDTGFIDHVDHTGGTNLYAITIKPAFVNANNEALGSIAEANPFSISTPVASLGAVINVNTYNAAGSGTEAQFYIALLEPAA